MDLTNYEWSDEILTSEKIMKYFVILLRFHRARDGMIVDGRLEVGGVCHDGSKYYPDIYSRHGTAHRGKDKARVSLASLVASGPC